MNSHDSVPTPTPRALDWCLHLLIVALLGLAAARSVVDAEPHAAWCVVAATVCGVIYGLGPALSGVRRSRRAAAVWLAALGLAWLVLMTLTPDAVWLAFPLYFLQLHLLPRRSAFVAVAATAVAAIVGFAVHRHLFTPGMAIGPALGAAVAVAVVLGYQALYRESDRRRRLIEELTATRADLAAVQHTAGVLAERDRLAREIHDTLAQGFSSIQLLLHAAERALPAKPADAADYVVQARQAAGDNLAEARRFVAALTPPSLDGTTLAGALERLCATTSSRHRIAAHFHLVGEPASLTTAQDVAVLRIAQSALANTVRHAGATRVDVTLRYSGTHVALEIVDDGRGFDAENLPAPDHETGGFGLAAMRSRVRSLGGVLTIESAPGEGTVMTTQIPTAQYAASPETEAVSDR